MKVSLTTALLAPVAVHALMSLPLDSEHGLKGRDVRHGQVDDNRSFSPSSPSSGLHGKRQLGTSTVAGLFGYNGQWDQGAASDQRKKEQKKAQDNDSGLGLPLAQKRQLLDVEGNTVALLDELVHNNNIAADVLGDIKGLDSSSTGAAPPQKRNGLFAGLGAVSFSKRHSSRDDAQKHHHMDEARPGLTSRSPSKRQLVALAANTVAALDELVHNNNDAADVFGNIEGLDSSSKSVAAPPAPAAEEQEGEGDDDSAPDEHTRRQCQAQAQTDCSYCETEEAKNECITQVQTQCQEAHSHFKRSTVKAPNNLKTLQNLARAKRQLKPLVVVAGNNVAVADELVHNNNVAADVLGDVGGLDSSSKTVMPPPQGEEQPSSQQPSSQEQSSPQTESCQIQSQEQCDDDDARCQAQAQAQCEAAAAAQAGPSYQTS